MPFGSSFALACLIAVAESKAVDEAPSLNLVDITKSTVIEKPTNTILAGNTAGLAVSDLTKTVHIEKPIRGLLAREASQPAKTGKEWINPKVLPGQVHWHASFESACEASKKSGKPVLLFQMMGKLNDQFC